jgi:hypothetical protein
MKEGKIMSSKAVLENVRAVSRDSFPIPPNSGIPSAPKALSSRRGGAMGAFGDIGA